MLLPFGDDEHVAPALWRWRARCSCALALASTLLLRVGVGEHASPALWRWRARFSCHLVLASALFLRFGADEHEEEKGDCLLIEGTHIIISEVIVRAIEVAVHHSSLHDGHPIAN